MMMASSQAAAAASAAVAREEYRRPLQQLLRKAGLLGVLEPAAFNELLEHAVDCEGRPEELEPVLDALLAGEEQEEEDGRRGRAGGRATWEGSTERW